MGVDVVTVGLRHTLRVNNPLLLFEDVSNRYNANIQVVYYNNNRDYDDSRVTLLELKKEDAVENLTIVLPHCQYLQQKTSPKVSSIVIDWQSKTLIKQLWDALCNNCYHYDIENFKGKDYQELCVYRETVDINIDTPFRWYTFLEKFTLEPEYHYPEDPIMVEDFRKELYTHAKLLGCEEVLYCADQDQGEFIYVQIYKPVDELLAYIEGNEYYKEFDRAIKKAKSTGAHQFSDYDIDWATNTEPKSISVDIPDFLLNKRDLIPGNLVIDVLFDDFRDLKAREESTI